MARITEKEIHGVLTEVIEMDATADELEDALRAQIAAEQAIESAETAQDAAERAEEAALRAEGNIAGVSSFNGRHGAVKPQTGDYTAKQVGAIPTTDKGKAGGVASLGADGKVLGEQLPEISSTKSTSATVLASGWLDETETTGLYRYRIENSNITATMSVDVHFSVTDHTEEQASSLVRATNHGVLAATTAGAGYVDIYCSGYKGTEFVGAPDTDLLVDIKLTEVKEV